MLFSQTKIVGKSWALMVLTSLRTNIAFAVLIFSSAALHGQKLSNLGPTPPMGWNSWDCFGTTVTEQEVKANADYMDAHLKAYGWEYIVIDGRWYVENPTSHGYNEKNPIIRIDSCGRFMPAVNRFPSSAGGKGFKPLAEYIHSKGLKFGIHLMRGVPKLAVEKNSPVLGTRYTAQEIYSTKELCTWLHDMYTVDAAQRGAQEYYNSVFKLLASWEIDFVKVDDLSRPYHKDEIELICKAIEGCGRPIVLSTSPGETPIEYAGHISSHATMWRIIDDFWDNWPEVNMHFSLFEKWIPYMGPGHWPDGDMLPLGRIGIRAERGDDRMSTLSKDEQITLMSLFLICRSPLMFGGNLPENDEFTLNLITNEEALAVLQRSKNNRLLFHDAMKIAWIADEENSHDKFLALFYTSDARPILGNNALWNSKLLSYKTGEQSVGVNVKIGEARKLYLVVTDGGNGNGWDHADWINPVLTGSKGSLDLTQFKWVSATSGWETAKINRSVGGNSLIVDTKEYAHGIGTHATSIIEYNIPKGYDTFSSVVGLDKECLDHTEGATVAFHVFTRHPSGSPPEDSVKISVKTSQLGFKSSCRVRDVWARRDIGEYANDISLYIPNHGARLLRISEIK